MKRYRWLAAVATLPIAVGLGVAGTAGASQAADSAFGNPLGLDEQRTAQLQQEIDHTLSVTTGGRQVSQYEIAWDDGAVQMSFPAPGSGVTPDMSPQAAALPNAAKPSGPDEVDAKPTACPAGWYCFFKDADFAGRMVKWSYRYCNNEFPQIRPFINFTDYDFNDQASSWANKSNRATLPAYIYVYKDVNASGDRLWHEQPGSNNSWVGPSANDQASSFKACERSP